MSGLAKNILNVSANHQPLIREIGLDADAIFDDPRIVVWRRLPDRENCTLDHKLSDGRIIRLHIKRYPAADRCKTATAELMGHQLLNEQAIPTASLVAYGKLADNRSFIIFENLAGHTPADKLVEAGTPFERLLTATADLAARLHQANLHHRDLYLCHFMAKMDSNSVDVKLIDTARVGRLNNLLTRKRWIVKDLAQFWYSTTKLPITDQQRERWLTRYSTQCGTPLNQLQPAIERKARAIARHDSRLNLRQPNRNISIPPRPQKPKKDLPKGQE